MALDLKSRVHCTGGSNPSHLKKRSGAVAACLLWEQEVGGSIPPFFSVIHTTTERYFTSFETKDT